MFNPFGFPGLEAMPNVAPLAGKIADSVDFVKNLWGGASSAVPGFLAPTLSVEELDKKITDLRAVESWLETNAALLRATVQSLEVQRNTLLMLKSLGQMNSGNSANTPHTQAATGSAATPDSADATSSPSQATPAMVNAAAWWNLLQDQFGKVAGAALAQTVPGRGLGATPPETKAAGTKTTKKTSSTKTPSRGKSTRPRKSTSSNPHP
jgi:hypothetical protein